MSNSNSILQGVQKAVDSFETAARVRLAYTFVFPFDTHQETTDVAFMV